MKKVALLGSIVLLFLMFDVRLKTVHYTIEAGLDDSITIVQISDLHGCRYGKNQEQLLEAIEAVDPDLIVLTGDIFDDVLPYDLSQVVIDDIGQKYPCYYVTGNHELWSLESELIKEKVRNAGIVVLEGTGDVWTKDGATINIVGIDDTDISAYSDDTVTAQLQRLSSFSNNGHYTVLLAHRPHIIDAYLGYGVDLVLSGHAHGGQWRLPGIINGLLAPDQGLFPKYTGGHYNFGSKDMIVSRGLARESTRVPRIFNRPELVVITLK